jgi:dihydropteroate synthase
MGILNVTPDSFSDGGDFVGADAAIAHALHMQGAGAAIIDVGGESTRPGSTGVSVEEELARVIPVLEALSGVVSVPLSVDVMALRREGALEAARQTGLPICLMHMRGTPETMQNEPQYTDVVSEIEAFLQDRIDAASAAGIDSAQLIVDPGFGFGKTDAHNAALLAGLPRLAELGLPVLAGLSRKSLVGRVLGRDMADRLAGSVAAAALATWQGARIIRAHDVAETLDAVRLADYVKQNGGSWPPEQG